MAMEAVAIDYPKRLVELEAAHLSNVEAPEAFNRAVLSFLRAPRKSRLARGAARKTAGRAPARGVQQGGAGWRRRS